MNTKTRSRRAPAKVALLLTLVLALLALPFAAASAASSHTTSGPKPTIVLVHGAWADSSGWNDSIKALQGKGYTALAVANPLRSLHGDAAYLSSVLDTITGPIVLVGHSYGGMVLTNAATDMQTSRPSSTSRRSRPTRARSRSISSSRTRAARSVRTR